MGIGSHGKSRALPLCFTTREVLKTVVLIMGKSGCGKSTLERGLIYQYPDTFKKVVSSTTRIRRPNELHGQDYYFLTQDEYDKTDFIQTTSFAGRRYGSSVSEYTTPHECPILCVVPDSAKIFTTILKKRFPEWKTFNIFFNISNNRLIANMKARGDTDEMISSRISQDTLDEDFEKSGLIADFIVCDADLNDKLPLTVRRFMNLSC